PKWRRIGAFFDTLDRQVFNAARKDFEVEILRITALAEATPAWGGRAFDELVRPRESLFRFSPVRAVMTDDVEATLDALYERYVEHMFATAEYQEVLLDRALRGVFRHEGLAGRYRKTTLGTDAVRFPVPFAEVGADGIVRRVIKPLHLAQGDPIRVLDHGNQWIGRLRHLQRQLALPAVLLPVQQPEAHADNVGAFEEVRQGLIEAGAQVVPVTDQRAILDFARAA
ncbi:phage associated protein, partial [mine drainage metagenome]